MKRSQWDVPDARRDDRHDDRRPRYNWDSRESSGCGDRGSGAGRGFGSSGGSYGGGYRGGGHGYEHRGYDQREREQQREQRGYDQRGHEQRGEPRLSGRASPPTQPRFSSPPDDERGFSPEASPQGDALPDMSQRASSSVPTHVSEPAALDMPKAAQMLQDALRQHYIPMLQRERSGLLCPFTLRGLTELEVS